MTSQDLASAVAGGALIGAAAGGLLLLAGRNAGISGMLAGLVKPEPGETAWRVFFVAGLVAGGVALAWLVPEALPSAPAVPLGQSIAAGLLVGLGARVAGGCTSGHGVCGVGRLSVRSLVATGLFMALGMATVWITRHGSGAL